MKNGDFCKRNVAIIEKKESLRTAATLMRKKHVGDLVVIEKKEAGNKPVGMITDRDIVIEVLADGVDIESLTVGDIMSFGLLTANENQDMRNTLKRMRIKGVRRCPIVNDQGLLVGILTMDDMIGYFAEHQFDLANIITREQEHEKTMRIPAD